MSDQFDSLFDELRGQRPPASFAPAEQVRRRGRQRARRQAALAGVAVLAVLGLTGGIAAAVTQPDRVPPPPAATGPHSTAPASPAPASPTAPPPTPSSTPLGPSPSTSPTPSEGVPDTIPGSWLLTAADLDGEGWQPTTNEMLEGAWYWDGAEAWCPEYRLEDYPSVPRRTAVDTVSWQRTGEAVPERVDQLVERFGGDMASQNISDVEAYVATCSRRPAEGDDVAPTYYEIEETGFAGDESLLIRVEQYHFNDQDEIEPAGEPHYVTVVRVGDAVTTIVHQAGGDPREVAQNAAARIG